MTSKETKTLEVEALQLRIDNLRLEKQIFRLRVANGELDVQSNSEWMQPHRRYPTQVFRSPNGDHWVCASYNSDPGDMYTNRPHGLGATPAAACADFDRNWTEGDTEASSGDCYA